MTDENFDFLIKIVSVGNSGAGKTNLISRYSTNIFKESTMTTIGVEFASKIVTMNNERIKFQIWDTAGQERYRAVVGAYYRGSSGSIIVYDITDEESFEGVAHWVEEIRKYSNTPMPLLIIGNKSDLEHLRKVETNAGKNLASKYDAGFMEVSAKTGENVNEAFMAILEKTIEYRKSMNLHRIKTSNQDIKKAMSNMEDSNCCC